MHSAQHIVKRIIVTEKSEALREVGQRYTFEVMLQANKNQIREAIKALFNVKVEGIQTMVMHGEIRKKTRGGSVKQANWKKAIVTLGVGQTIEVFPQA